LPRTTCAKAIFWLAFAVAFVGVPGLEAQESPPVGNAAEPIIIPILKNGSLRPAQGRQELSTALQILILLTLLTLAPAILIMTTCFTRIIVVLALLRQALATQQLPPNQVLVGLALFLTFLIMAPTWTGINQDAVQPYLEGEITQLEAIKAGNQHLRNFLFDHTRVDDITMMMEVSGHEVSTEVTLHRRDVPTVALVPAFVISELKTAFWIGFLIFLPFLVIDIVVSSVLISMGMLMLPPVLISLPFKLLLFVLSDGWRLVTESLVKSFMLSGP